MTTTAHTKSEESNKMVELSAKLLDSKVVEVARHQAGAEAAAAEANNAAARAQVMFEGCQANMEKENRYSVAGGIGGLVGSTVGIAAALVVSKRMGLDPNATASLAGGAAVVGGGLGGLSGVGVNAFLESRKDKK